MRARISPSGRSVEVSPAALLSVFAPGDPEGAGWTPSGGALVAAMAGGERLIPLSLPVGDVVSLGAVHELTSAGRVELVRRSLSVGAAAPGGWEIVETLPLPAGASLSSSSLDFRHAVEPGQVWALRLVVGSVIGGSVYALSVGTEAP